MTKNVFSIPSGVPFLKVFAEGLLERHAHDGAPDALADVLVLLPTQRAVSALRSAFEERLLAVGGGAIVLPRLAALGDVDEDELDLAKAIGGPFAGADAVLPSIPPIRRRVHLARLIHRLLTIEEPATPWSHALSWAESLAQLLDEALIEGADLSRLEEAVPQDLAAHWERSRAFLSVIAAAWPDILKEEGAIDAVDRRNRLMAAQMEAWLSVPPGPVYVAGSTGSQPATAKLMVTVASLPQGGVVLPGLDAECDEETWDAVNPVHPQWALKNWLERAELTRADVKAWSSSQSPPGSRMRLLSEVLRPAPTTDSWAGVLQNVDLDVALEGLSLVKAEDPAEEARIISLLMREALETPGRTAALVTPERGLARRVAADLLRWGAVVDDSAGIPLSETAVWLCLRLIAQVIQTDWAPLPLLALLKSPLVLLGQDFGSHARALDGLERYALRGVRPQPGAEGLLAGLVSARQARQSQSAALSAFEEAEALVHRIGSAFAPLTDENESLREISDWASLHVQVAEALAASQDELGADRLWLGPAGEAAANLMSEIAVEANLGLVSFADYAELLIRLAAGRAVRPRRGQHPRLHIWGPLEARLQSADLMILGGLTEETWPQRPETGPWVNTAMREHIGLKDPERRIGLSAHDFQELASAPQVVLTLSNKVDRQPALPSRWVLRLENFLKGQGRLEQVETLTDYQKWAASLDRPSIDEMRTASPPEPRPAVDLRPRRISVTEVETYLRDPYAIYAKYVLGLKPLDPIDEEPGPRQVGILIHVILEAFVRAHAGPLSEDALGSLLTIAKTAVTKETSDAYEARVWQARVGRAAAGLLSWEDQHRESYMPTALEVRGALEVEAPAGQVTIHGRADRIDRNPKSGHLAIIDYKTGQPPSINQMKEGLAPQLLVEALMAQSGGFEDLPAAVVDTLIYLRIGAKDGFGNVTMTSETQDALVKTADMLARLFAHFDNPQAPYLSWPVSETEGQSGSYDLLARVPAWRGQGGVE